MTWESLDQDRSWRFHCSACGGMVYWPQSHKGKLSKTRRCPYPTCPWCGERLERETEKKNPD